jgi:hypothetical protein
VLKRGRSASSASWSGSGTCKCPPTCDAGGEVSDSREVVPQATFIVPAPPNPLDPRTTFLLRRPGERPAPQDDRVTLVTNVRLVCDATRPVTSQQPTVGNVTAVDWKPVNP